MALDGGFRPEEKNQSVDWSIATEDFLDNLYAEAGPSDEDLRKLENAAEKLLSMDIQEDGGSSLEDNLDQTLRLAQLLQVALEYEVYERDKIEEQLEDNSKEIAELQSQADSSKVESLKLRADDLQEKLEEVQDKLNDRERELRSTKESLEEEQRRKNRLEKELKEETKRYKDASDRAKAAEEELHEKEQLLMKEQKKQSHNAQNNDKEMEALRKRNREFLRIQKDNKDLERKQVELEAALEESRRQNREVDMELVGLADEKRDWGMREGQLKEQVEELERERSDLLSHTEELSAAVEEKMELLNEFETKFKRLCEEWEERLAEKDEELLAGLEERERLLMQINHMHAEINGVDQPRSHTPAYQPSKGANPDDLETLKAKLESKTKEAEDLGNAYFTLEHDVAKEVEAALEKQSVRLLRLEADNEHLKGTIEKERSAQERLEKDLLQRIEDLQEAENRLEQYEKGIFGLPEAIRDIKRLKRELRAGDEQSQKHIRRMNEYSEHIESLLEQVQYLREQMGISMDQELDLGDFRMKRQIEAQSLRALNAQLEAEVRDLEEERCKLRTELRYRAKWHGEAAAKMGLTSEQVILLEEYRDELRYGDDAVLQDVMVSQLEQQVTALKGKLADVLLGKLETHQPVSYIPSDDGDLAILSDLQRQLSLSKVEAATLQQSVVQAKEENERLVYENRRIGQKVLSALERIQSGKVPRADQMQAQLERVLHTLQGALEDPSAAPLAGLSAPVMRLGTDAVARFSGESVGNSHEAAGQELVGGVATVQELAMLLEMMRRERDHYKAAAGGGGVAPPPPSAVAESLLGLGLNRESSGAREGSDLMSTEDELDRHALELQLLECLQEQSKKDERLEEMTSEVERYKHLLQEMGDVRSMVYREHVRLRADWKAEEAALRSKLKNAEGELREKALQLQETERLVDRLKGGTQAELKAHLIKATNDLTLTQVRELRLARHLDASKSAEQAYLSEKQDLMQEIEELLNMSQRKHGDLIRAKNDADQRVVILQRDVDMSVRREAYNHALDLNRDMQAKYMRLMAETTDATVRDLDIVKLQEELQRVQADHASLSNEMHHYKNKSEELEKALVVPANPEEVTLAAQKLANVQLTVELRNAQRQNEYDAKERTRLEEAKGELESRLQDIQDQLTQMSTRLHAAQEAEAGYLRRLANSVTLEQYRLDSDASAKLQKQVVDMQAEITLKAEQADIAEAKLHKTITDQHARNLELNGLREAIRKIEQTSDTKAALGKLHEEILRMRTHEVQLKHATARTESQNDRLEAENQRLLRRVTERETAFFTMQQEMRHVLREHEEALQRLEHTIRGRVETRKAAEWSRALLDLKQRNTRLVEEMGTLRTEKYDFQDRLYAADARLEQATHAARVQKGEFKISELHQQNIDFSEKILQLKLAESRLTREAHMLNERVHFLEKIDEEREESTLRMEEDALRTRANHEQQLEDLARRVRTLQSELLEAKRALAAAPKQTEDNSITRLTTRLASRNLLTTETPKLAAQIELDRKQIDENKETIMSQLDTINQLKIERQEAKSETEVLREDLRNIQNCLSIVETERNELQRRLEVWSSDLRKGTMSAEDTAIEQITEVARVAMKRMQAQVEEKDGEIQSLQAQIKRVREDAIDQHRKDLEEIDGLHELLYTKTNMSIGNLKRVLTEAKENGHTLNVKKIDNTASNQSYQELLQMLAEREQEVVTLNAKYEEARSQAEVLQVRLEDTVKLKSEEVERLQQELEREQTRGPSQVMESLVSKLKGQMQQKDKKLGQLKEAIKQLEARLIDAMKANATEDMQVSQSKSIEAQAAQAESLQNQLAEYKEKVARLKEEVIKYKNESQAKDKDSLRAASDLTKAEATTKQLATELTRERRMLRTVKSKEARAQIASGTQQKEKEDKSELLQKRIHVLTAQNNKLTALLRNENSQVKGMQIGMEALDPLKLKNLEEKIAEKDKTIERLNETLENASKMAHTVSGRAYTNEAKEKEKASRREESLLMGNPALEQWEAGKQLQKKVDILRKKLEEKTKLLEASEKTILKLQDRLEDATKERDKLTAHVRKMTGGGASPDTKSQHTMLEAELRKLHMDLKTSESEYARLQTVVHVAQQKRVKTLEHQVAKLQEDLEAAQADSKGRGNTTEDIKVLKRDIRDLEERVLQAENISLELRFEKEQATLRANRLQDRLQLFLDRGWQSQDAGTQSKRPGSAKDSQGRVAELEDVVEAMKRVVDKLRVENEQLKKNAHSSRQYMSAVNKVKELKKQVETLQEEKSKAEGQEDKLLKSDLYKQVTHLQEANADLKVRLQRASDAAAAAAHTSTSQTHQDSAEQEMERLRAELLSKTRVASTLQRQLEQTDHKLVQLQSALKDSGARHQEIGELTEELKATKKALAAAKAENRDLKNELNAFDPAFFDEIEDLKHSHHKLEQACGTYERLLRQYTSQLGISFTVQR